MSRQEARADIEWTIDDIFRWLNDSSYYLTMRIQVKDEKHGALTPKERELFKKLCSVLDDAMDAVSDLASATMETDDKETGK